MNIAELFFNAAEKFPSHVAIVDPKRSITYTQLKQEVAATAINFSQKGIKSGDRVLVFVPMSIDLYRIVLALFSIGATAVFLDEWVNLKRLRLCCQLADCKAIIGGAKVQIFSWVFKELRVIPIKLNLQFPKSPSEKLAVLSVEPTQSALITFTTGSTGTPKAADRSHAFLKEQFEALLDEIEPTSKDIDMPLLPIVLFMNLGVGCTSVIPGIKTSKPDKIKPEHIYKWFNDQHVTRFTASPAFVKLIAGYCINSNKTTNNIKKIFTGGAPVFPQEAKLIGDAFPNAQFKIVYGSTEAEPISSTMRHTLLNTDLENDGGLFVGEPYHKAQVKIISISDSNIELKHSQSLKDYEVKHGEIGEIIVSGPHVLDRYFQNEEALKRNKIWEEKRVWHRTGDAGFFKNKHLYLVGRCNQLIYRDDKIISPFVIENILSNLNGITLGTVLEINQKIVLVLETKLSRAEVASGLPKLDYDDIKLVKHIPRDPRHNSKIDYGGLGKMVLG